MAWNDIQMAGITRIERVVAEFDVWVDTSLPFAKFRMKVIERVGKGFLASPNVAIRNRESGTPEWIGGLGNSIEESLRDGLANFWREVEQNKPSRDLTLEDFCWADHEDF